MKGWVGILGDKLHQKEGRRQKPGMMARLGCCFSQVLWEESLRRLWDWFSSLRIQKMVFDFNWCFTDRGLDTEKWLWRCQNPECHFCEAHSPTDCECLNLFALPLGLLPLASQIASLPVGHWTEEREGFRGLVGVIENVLHFRERNWGFYFLYQFIRTWRRKRNVYSSLFFFSLKEIPSVCVCMWYIHALWSCRSVDGIKSWPFDFFTLYICWGVSGMRREESDCLL